MINQSKTHRQDKIRKVIAGITKYYANDPQVRLGGATYTPAALEKLLADDIAASDAADQAKAAWLVVVEAQRATWTRTNPVLRAIRSLVLGQHGDAVDASDVLAVFGYAPRKPRKPTGKAIVKAAAKAAATRKARGTLGPKQKEEIKGEAPPPIPPVVVSPK